MDTNSVAGTSDSTEMASSGYYSAYSSSSHMTAAAAEETSPSNILHNNQAMLPLSHGYQRPMVLPPHHQRPTMLHLHHPAPSTSDMFRSGLNHSTMQTMMYSNNTCYHHTNNMTQLLPPSQPPPNYSEATSLETQHAVYNGHFVHSMPPNYNSIMTGNEYPSGFTAALPNHSSRT